MALTQVTSAGLKDGEILNADINASAAITGTKVTPNFGSQNVVTTGTLGSSNLTITNTAPWIQFTDTDTNPDWLLQNSNGAFVFHDGTTTRLQLNNDGHVDVTGNLDVGAGVDVTGSISVSGTVDGVDIAARNTLFGGLTSSSGVLTNGVTATTQSASDNSTKVATTAYTDTAISNLVDSSPSALNTLNELAAALGDDANFSTTVTNSIATKLPLAGGTLTGNVLHNDNVKALFGTGSDLQIYHDGTKNIIKSTNGNIEIDNNSEYMARFLTNGAVELYYDNSKKFETISSGVSVTGHVHASGAVYSDNFISTTQSNGHSMYIKARNAVGNESTLIKATIGGSVELNHNTHKKLETTAAGIYVIGDIDLDDGEFLKAGTHDDLWVGHDGSHSYINHNGQGAIFIQSSGGFALQKYGSTERLINAHNDGAVELFYNGTKKFETTSDGVSITGEIQMTDHTSGSTGMVILGADGDAKLFHNNSNAIIQTNTGELRVLMGNDNGIIAKPDGAVELYYNGSKTVETGVNQLTLYGNSSECNLEFKTSDNTRRAFIGSTNGNNITFYNAASEKIWHYANNAQIELYYNDAKKYETRSDGGLVTGTLYFNDTNTSVSEGSGNGVKIANNYGHVEIGPQNSTWCHINTDRGSFYMNKHVSVDGNHAPYGNNQHSSGTTGDRWSNVYSQGLNVTRSSGNLSAVIQADSGLGTMEIAGSSGAFIDFKSPTSDDYDLRIGTSGSGGYFTVPSGHIECSASFIPNANNSRDLGSSSLRWRDLYIMDLQLSNKGGANEVDGTWGDWTLQEGETDVFMINNRTGKRYKMALQEVS